MEKEFFSWEFLNTYIGSAACTSVIVELTKGSVDLLPVHISTQYLVYFVALVILNFSKVFTEGLTWKSFILNFFNAALTAITAIGGYEVLHKITKGG